LHQALVQSNEFGLIPLLRISDVICIRISNLLIWLYDISLGLSGADLWLLFAPLEIKKLVQWSIF